MFSAGDLLGLLLVAQTTLALLIWQRRGWLRAREQLQSSERPASRARWLSSTACVSVAAISCAIAARLNVGTTTGPLDDRALILAVDVSRSMYAEDIAPSRLERGKRLLMRELDRAPGRQVAVVAFAGDAAVVCPLTVDHDAVRVALGLLSEDMAPAAGTSIGAGLAEAIRTVGEPNRRFAILLVTDGENLAEPVDAAVMDVRERGAPVHVLAIGTTGGAPVPRRPEETAARGERAVITRLDDALLRALAQQTGGQYRAVSSDGALDPPDLISGWRPSADALGRPMSADGHAYRLVVLTALMLLSAATVLSHRS